MSPVGLGEYYHAFVDSKLLIAFWVYYILAFIFVGGCLYDTEIVDKEIVYFSDIATVIILTIIMPFLFPLILIYVIFQAITSLDFDFVVWRKRK